ncbi:MAG: FadR family transcriptional regulator [Flavobacteriaceae bacterium]|jgi:GntR family transcriptional repressor for pyruvate dehydrogenase complex|uniref:FadR family transcriptional regulator n=1 Tax=Flavobacterium kayseriense TaxID=2764714 RepID=A0ABR7J511_9FLAO|nr:FadR/GntR family transcriptional regulator [Flavobacterium kayseriense]MBC5840635.1 FadR family transcriptional regulator [Flavobacterium kayseriense]MBC5846695.1 FadR family transcriptional regulator [Flavobacterium kayseriense]MBU0942687.1 FadR family transcriptional regulator [Bacteroidota bacterium]MBX9888611.1 FadR family transcriptional regulator [Flavobacteriaceae bacterium]
MKLEVISRKDNKESVNTIIAKIRDYINYKNLEPQDKLPSERMLSEKFEASRSSVREAIQKLEFYGILKSIPQSGTFVADIGKIAINGIIDDILRLGTSDFKSLVETRILIELKTVRLAATRRTEEDIAQIKAALDAYSEKVYKGEDAVQEDLIFHLAIAKASGNSTINNLMLLITPEILTNFEKYHVCTKSENEGLKVIKEHTEVFDAIVAQNPQLAKQKMKEHFKALYEYCYNI